MPELLDITVYLDCLAPKVVGGELAALRITSPILLRSVELPVAEVEGRTVVGLRRIGNRIVLGEPRDERLRRLSGGRAPARRPRAVTAPEVGLAARPRGAGGRG